MFSCSQNATANNKLRAKNEVIIFLIHLHTNWLLPCLGPSPLYWCTQTLTRAFLRPCEGDALVTMQQPATSLTYRQVSWHWSIGFCTYTVVWTSPVDACAIFSSSCPDLLSNMYIYHPTITSSNNDFWLFPKCDLFWHRHGQCIREKCSNGIAAVQRVQGEAICSIVNDHHFSLVADCRGPSTETFISLFIHIPDEDTACSYNQVQQKLCRVI